MDYATGVHDGMTWIEIPVRIDATYATPATRDVDGPLVILRPRASGRTSASALADIAAGRVHSHLSGDVGIRPFDEMETFPGRKVSYYKHAFQMHDLSKWLLERVEAPSGVDMRFEHDGWRSTLHAVARTVRNGAVTDVRRRIANDLPVREALVPTLRYFERNCPRADGDVGPAGRPHVRALLSMQRGVAWDRASHWLRTTTETTSRDPLVITVEMTPDMPGLRWFTLRRSDHGELMLASVLFDAGHRIEEDEKGVTIQLEALFPESALSAMRGRDVSEVLEAPWLKGLAVRTARQEHGKVTLRASADASVLALEPRRESDQADVVRRLSAWIVGEGRLLSYGETARRVMEPMDAETLLHVLTLLERASGGIVRLDGYGWDGWSLRLSHRTVEVVQCPQAPLHEMVASAIARVSGEVAVGDDKTAS